MEFILNHPNEEDSTALLTQPDLLNRFPKKIPLITIKNLCIPGRLHNINMSIMQGEKIAFIGNSGAGKSTLLNVLVGLQNEYAGLVFFNDINIKNIPKNQLRQVITLLSSDAKIISGTVLQNILLSQYTCTKPVEVSLSLANIRSKIISLPQQLETVIGENKANLSSGEKQRIKLARAFQLASKIHLFDEITSQLDITTETTIIENILKQKTSTLIFVTHKLMHLPQFDRIYYFNNHEIVESGHHNQLLQTKGGYYQLWQSYQNLS